MTFPSYKSVARWEVFVGTKLTRWFCAVQIDSKVEEEEETFVILMAEHNISYSCGDTLMKLIKGSFHRQKTCQGHKHMSNKIQCLRGMQALVCYCVTDLSFLSRLCSFTSFMPLPNPPFLFFVLSISWWAQYHMEWNMINLGLPSWQCPLSASSYSHFWGREKTQNFDSQGGKWKLLDSPPCPLPPTPIQKGSSWKCKRLARNSACPVDPTWQKGCSTQSDVLQLEQLQARRRKGGCLLW